MKLGEYELNNIYNENCYDAIKKIPDKSIDLIYTDIPYSFTGNGLVCGGGKFGTKKRDYHKEYEKVSINTENSLAKRKSSSSSECQDIAYGIDYSILDELVRVMKHIYIYGAVRNKYYHLWNTLLPKSIVSTRY